MKKFFYKFFFGIFEKNKDYKILLYKNIKKMNG